MIRCHVMSCHAMSCHVMSCLVMSCHVMSCHVMSCHVMSCDVMSCQGCFLQSLSRGRLCSARGTYTVQATLLQRARWRNMFETDDAWSKHFCSAPTHLLSAAPACSVDDMREAEKRAPQPRAMLEPGNGLQDILWPPRPPPP